MSKRLTKDNIKQTACELFYYNGYEGTSIRDIASKAKVNPSLISYYFKNKKGLLETLMIDYFEPYMELLEKNRLQLETKAAQDIINDIIHYRHNHYEITCFLYRELSFDTVLVREMLVTYLAKEKHILMQFLNFWLHRKVSQADFQTLFIQFKGMLMIPFTMPHDFKYDFLWDPGNKEFIKRYSLSVGQWVTTLSLVPDQNNGSNSVSS
ncbi:forespore capture DNA-binding protein RefZ [Bacillaceae bacterium S4-13-58]